MTEIPQNEIPAETLARSAFGFAIFALIPAIITWIFFWLAPPSPDPTFRLIRWGIIGGFAVILLFLLWMTVYFYNRPQEKLLPASQRIVRLIGNARLSVIVILLIIEINILVFLLLQGIASSITNPAKFLMVCWSLLLIGIVITVNREKYSHWYEKSRGLFLSTGIFVIGIACLGGLFALNSWIVNLTGINDNLRGGLDYRELIFVDDGNTPTASEFWSEQAQTRIRWSPYTYWVLEEFDGEFININSEGIRFTPDYGGDEDLFIFGGSTVWGEGARDDYTIPGHIARLLHENGNPHNVINYGQTGYVSSQDLIWFQRQLIHGNIPDSAIFYQGFNDVLSSWGSDVVGVTLQENMRLNDAEAGRRLRSGQAVFQLPDIALDRYDMSAAGVIEATPESIADFWFANLEMTQSIADAYDVNLLFVWQPAIIFKDTMSESEQAIYNRTENERAGLFDLYTEVDAIIRERIESGDYENIIVLSDLFVENEDTIFHDLVHITEIGNGIVAEAILPYLLE